MYDSKMIDSVKLVCTFFNYINIRSIKLMKSLTLIYQADTVNKKKKLVQGDILTFELHSKVKLNFIKFQHYSII